MALSYPDAIRDVIYRNISDTSLIEYGELHPGMTFHTGIAWMISYGLLDGALQACDASSLADHIKPEPRIGITFPILGNDLQAQDVPVLWNNETREQERLCLENHTTGITCAYQFIAHMLGASNADQVQKAVESVAMNIHGWEATGYPVKKPRLTWQVIHNNATFTIQMDNMKVPINRLLVLYIKSYGVEWESVHLDLVVEGIVNNESSRWTELKRIELTGCHNSTTSIKYSEQVDLGSALEVGSSVRATFTLTQGAKFQINGLAFWRTLCSDIILYHPPARFATMDTLS